MKVNTPITKQQILDFFIDGGGGPHMLSNLAQHESEESFLKGTILDDKFNSLEECLKMEYGYEDNDPRMKEEIAYIRAYFKLFKKDEILIVVGGELSLDNDISKYSKIKVEYIGDGEHLIMCYNPYK
jgi:hypothetical protein